MSRHVIKSVFGRCVHHQYAAIQIRRVHLQASKLVYSEYGDPLKVVQLQEEHLSAIQPNEVLIKMLAAPVNPADINTIQGKYPSRPVLPAVPGNEGVGQIVEVGSSVRDFQIGDHVVPLANLLGTWRTHLILDQQQLLMVPSELGLIQASTLTVNPCTAYRMLKDFVKLEKGDVVIQNGANSACGQIVIQLAKYWGFSTVNIIRNRPDVNILKKYLENLGADEVLTEEELRTTDLFRSKKRPKPKLALNCVGGKNALEVIRHLDNGASIVTYGGMSREPLTVPTSALIFKDINVRGFWMTAWGKNVANYPDRMSMFNELIEFMCQGIVKAPATQMVQFEEFKEALMHTMTIQGMIGKKYILEF